MGRIAGARVAAERGRGNSRTGPIRDEIGFFRQRGEEVIERDPKNAGAKMPELSEKFAGDLFTGSKITPEAMNFFRQCGLSSRDVDVLFEFLRTELHGDHERAQFIKLMVELRSDLPEIMFLLGRWPKYGAKIAPELGNDYRALFTRILRTTPDYARKHLRGWLSKLDQILEQEEMMKKMMAAAKGR